MIVFFIVNNIDVVPYGFACNLPPVFGAVIKLSVESLAIKLENWAHY
jgi:hypothetical protein